MVGDKIWVEVGNMKLTEDVSWDVERFEKKVLMSEIQAYFVGIHIVSKTFPIFQNHILDRA